MDYQKICTSQIEALWELQKLYKTEIGEDEPLPEGSVALTDWAALFR